MKNTCKKTIRSAVCALLVAVVTAAMCISAFAEQDAEPGYGYLPPPGEMIQGNIMLISEDVPEQPVADLTADVAAVPASVTVKTLFGRSANFTVSQSERVLTLTADRWAAVLNATVGDMRALMAQGVSCVVFATQKTSTTLNLSLLCEGYDDDAALVLKHIGSTASLKVSGSLRRDLLIGR